MERIVMNLRSAGCVAVSFLLVLGVTSGAPYAGEWLGAEIVAFRDFDDLEVKLGKNSHKAFFVGLQPIRESTKGQEQVERIRKEVLAFLRKSALSVRIVTRRGEVLGLSIDTFAHHKNGFDHPWNPGSLSLLLDGVGSVQLQHLLPVQENGQLQG
jgi:hypothetical protein